MCLVELINDVQCTKEGWLLIGQFTTLSITITIGWITMEFCTDIHSPQRLHPNDFGDPP